jgi:hypothetical protein
MANLKDEYEKNNTEQDVRKMHDGRGGTEKIQPKKVFPALSSLYNGPLHVFLIFLALL